MLRQLMSFLKTKSDEEFARELFESKNPEAPLEKNANGEYLDFATQAAWDEFLTEYIQSTWW